MDRDEFRDRWRGAAAWFDASPSELFGLALVALGALAVAGWLWWAGPSHPHHPHPPLPAMPEAAPLDAADGLVGGDTVLVHVAGAVMSPGLVEVAAGSRVADAIAAAGGLVADADVAALNLARPLHDGERVDVARVGEVEARGAEAGGDPSGGGGIRADGRVDLNRATAAELETLPGVGPVLASRIVAHREANGPFTEVGQLRQVSGIGERTFQSLADLVAV